MWFASLLAVLLVAMVWVTASAVGKEAFVVSAVGTGGDSLDQRLVNAYQSVLRRNPTGKELTTHQRLIAQRKTTLDGVARELKGGDEYVRSLKLQSDGLMPELPRIISDRDLMDRITLMYRKEKKKPPPKLMLLPLRDVYMMLNYSDAYFIAFLRQANYADLEAAVKNDPEFDRDKLIAWMQDNVDTAQLDADAAEIQKELDEEAARNARSSLSAEDLAAIQAMIDEAGLGGSGDYASADHLHDTDSTEYLRFLQRICQHAFDKDGEAPEACKRIQVPTHVGNPYVLRPEFAWAMPMPQPPVCTSLGQPSLLQPTVAFTDNLLLGTSLEEAEDTAVGSLLPQFEFSQFVEPRPTAAQCKRTLKAA